MSGAWGGPRLDTLTAPGTYTDGKAESCKGNDLFYWPPGHGVRVVQDAEIILSSPQHEHTEVLDHMLDAMKG